MVSGISCANTPALDDGEFSKLVGLVLARSLREDGRLSADAASIAGLRDEPSRETLLRKIVIDLMPDNANPALWIDWLHGGGPPPAQAKLKRPGTDGQSLTRGLSRSSARVTKAERELKQAEASAKRADEQAAKAKEKLAEVAAQDAAIVEYAFTEHLVRILAPMFAMGPAWTIMRAVSAHVPAEEMTEELKVVADPTRRPARATAVREQRLQQTNIILNALDRWAGDRDFETAIRKALYDVAVAHSKRRPPADRDRSWAAMKHQLACPTLADEAEAVLDGMKREPF